MSDYMEYAEYYKKAWENSLKERTTELQEEIKALQAENALLKDQVKFGVDSFNALNEENEILKNQLDKVRSSLLQIESLQTRIKNVSEALKGDITPEKGGE